MQETVIEFITYIYKEAISLMYLNQYLGAGKLKITTRLINYLSNRNSS